ncbi:MAG: glycosyltransferase, partial [Pleurocapsa sp. CRU_1_2]|nr:glycosyltransferase [Pleurocapsa sp. CRU_1_2]
LGLIQYSFVIARVHRRDNNLLLIASISCPCWQMPGLHFVICFQTYLSLQPLRICPPNSLQSLPLAMKWLYPRADAVAGVSAGVARDLEHQLGLKKETVRVLNNPVVNDDLIALSHASLDHPWFAPDQPPVFLAVGRLNPQKDFPNLLNAFAQVRKQQAAHLIILGEGQERQKLESIIDKLNISNDVLLPGFVTNPYPYMKRASCLVLSSKDEGLPTVLIEAMACGCPVVATDCPSGPEEILARGTYGLLVAVKNSEALGEAMLETLKNPPAQELIIQRAKEYSTEKSVEAYLALLHEL